MNLAGDDRFVVQVLLRLDETGKASDRHTPRPRTRWELQRALERSSPRSYTLLQTYLWLADDLFTGLSRVPSPHQSDVEGMTDPASSPVVLYGLLDVASSLVDVSALLLLLQDLTAAVPGCRARTTLLYVDPRPLPTRHVTLAARPVSGYEDAIASCCVSGVLSGALALPADCFTCEVHQRRGVRNSSRDVEKEFPGSYWLSQGEVYYVDAREEGEEWVLDASTMPTVARLTADGGLSRLLPVLTGRLTAEARLTDLLRQHLRLFTAHHLFAPDAVVREVTVALPPAAAVALHTILAEAGAAHRGSAVHRARFLHAVARYHTDDDGLVPQRGAWKPPGGFHQVGANGPLRERSHHIPFVIPRVVDGLSAEEQLEKAYAESDKLADTFAGVDAMLRSGRYLRVRIPVIRSSLWMALLATVSELEVLSRELFASSRRRHDVPCRQDVNRARSSEGQQQAAVQMVDRSDVAGLSDGSAPDGVPRRQTAASRAEVMGGLALSWAVERWHTYCGEEAAAAALSSTPDGARACGWFRAHLAAAEKRMEELSPNPSPGTEHEGLLALCQLEASLMSPFPPDYTLSSEAVSAGQTGDGMADTLVAPSGSPLC